MVMDEDIARKMWGAYSPSGGYLLRGSRPAEGFQNSDPCPGMTRSKANRSFETPHQLPIVQAVTQDFGESNRE